MDFGSSPELGSGIGGVFLSNIDLAGGVAAIGGETDDDDGWRFIDEKSADEDDGGLGVPPDSDLDQML
jgi:hypothetical protein